MNLKKRLLCLLLIIVVVFSSFSVKKVDAEPVTMGLTVGGAVVYLLLGAYGIYLLDNVDFNNNFLSDEQSEMLTDQITYGDFSDAMDMTEEKMEWLLAGVYLESLGSTPNPNMDPRNDDRWKEWCAKVCGATGVTSIGYSYISQHLNKLLKYSKNGTPSTWWGYGDCSIPVGSIDSFSVYEFVVNDNNTLSISRLEGGEVLAVDFFQQAKPAHLLNVYNRDVSTFGNLYKLGAFTWWNGMSMNESMIILKAGDFLSVQKLDSSVRLSHSVLGGSFALVNGNLRQDESYWTGVVSNSDYAVSMSYSGLSSYHFATNMVYLEKNDTFVVPIGAIPSSNILGLDSDYLDKCIDDELIPVSNAYDWYYDADGNIVSEYNPDKAITREELYDLLTDKSIYSAWASSFDFVDPNTGEVVKNTNSIVEDTGSILSSIKALPKGIWQKFKGALNGISLTLGGIKDFVVDGFTSVAQSIPSVTDIGSAITGAVGGLLGGISSTLTNVCSYVSALPGEIASGIKGLFIPSKADMTAIKDKFSDILDTHFGITKNELDFLLVEEKKLPDIKFKNMVIFPGQQISEWYLLIRPYFGGVIIILLIIYNINKAISLFGEEDLVE